MIAVTFFIINVATTRIWLGQFEGAEKAYREGIVYYQNQNDYYGMAKMYFQLGNLKSLLGDFQDSILEYM